MAGETSVRPGYTRYLTSLPVFVGLVFLVISLLGAMPFGIGFVAAIVSFVIAFGVWKGVKACWYLLLLGAVIGFMFFLSFLTFIVGAILLYSLFRVDVKQWFGINYKISSETEAWRFAAIVLILTGIGMVGTRTSTNIVSANCTPLQTGYICQNPTLNTNSQTFSVILGLPSTAYRPYYNVSFTVGFSDSSVFSRQLYPCISSMGTLAVGKNLTVTCAVSPSRINQGSSYTGKILMNYNFSPGKPNANTIDTVGIFNVKAT